MKFTCKTMIISMYVKCNTIYKCLIFKILFLVIKK